MPTDEELMVAYVAGDAAAFREIFKRYAPLLLRVMARELRTREEANDLVQQTFLHLHRARLDYNSEQKLKPWLFTIAMNLKREHFRRTRRRGESSLDTERVPEPGVAPRGQEQLDAAREVQRALGKLSAEQREVIELHWLGGLAFPEVAEVVGSTVTAVKVRAHRGYVALRTLLGDSPLPVPQEAGNRSAGSSIAEVTKAK